MFKRFIFPLLCFSLFVSACSGGSKEEGTEQDDSAGMEQFAEDEEFKDAHEKPDQLDFDPKGEMMEFDTPDGAKGSAYAIMNPDEATRNYLFVIQEWWGLNAHIKQEAEQLFHTRYSEGDEMLQRKRCT